MANSQDATLEKADPATSSIQLPPFLERFFPRLSANSQKTRIAVSAMDLLGTLHSNSIGTVTKTSRNGTGLLQQAPSLILLKKEGVRHG